MLIVVDVQHISWTTEIIPGPDPDLFHKENKARTLLTGVEGDVFLDHEGNLVSVDDDYSLDEEGHELVMQTLKVELKELDEDNDSYKTKEKVVRVFITRIDRVECEGLRDIRNRIVFRVFFSFFLTSLHTVLPLYTSGGVLNCIRVYIPV